MSVIEKGCQRYRRYQRLHQDRFGRISDGRLLDFGCGAGGFLMAALLEGRDVFGVEVDQERERQFILNAERFAPHAANRLRMYDGRTLPFENNSFESCYSWFVFEHVSEPQSCLREIVRTLRPGGTLSIFADDARNCWDGHAGAPWPPYLPREFACAYADGLGIPEQGEFLQNDVVFISAPMIADILSTLGMRIVYANDAPELDPALVRDSLQVTSEDAARALGRKVAARKPWKSPSENLTIFAERR